MESYNKKDQKDKDKKKQPQWTYNAERVVGNGSFGVVF